MPTKFVRVKDPDTGHEVTVPARFAEQHKLEVLDKEALDDNGRPLPGKPHIELQKADAAGSGTPETDPATSSTSTPSTETGSASSAGTASVSGSGQQAGKAATK